MFKSRTAQLVFLSMTCALGVIGIMASVGFFRFEFKKDFYVQYTYISNYFCIGVLFAELIQTIRKKTDSYVSACPLLKFMGILAILITFIMYNFILAPGYSMASNFTINSFLLHILMPVLYIADWFLFYERKKVKWTYPIYSISLPLAYVIFIYVHAAILKFDSSIIFAKNTPLIYPYFFLNLDKMGVIGVLKWILMIFVAFVTVGYILYALDKVSFKKKLK